MEKKTPEQKSLNETPKSLAEWRKLHAEICEQQKQPNWFWWVDNKKDLLDFVANLENKNTKVCEW
jgi:hypothetical protein